MTTNDRLGRNHRPSENWDECSLIFLGEEADVGMKGEALCQKKTGEARQSRHKSKAQQNNEGDALGSTSLLSPSGGCEILISITFCGGCYEKHAVAT